jgi:hypothetical protein
MKFNLTFHVKGDGITISGKIELNTSQMEKFPLIKTDKMDRSAVHLPFHPQLNFMVLFMVLALWTMAVTAGSECYMLGTAFVAFINDHAASACPALHEGFDDLFMRIGHGYSKGCHILWPKGPKNLIN